MGTNRIWTRMHGQSLSRRSLIGAGMGAAALLALRPAGGSAWPVNEGFVSGRASAPQNWRTWLLTSGSELRPTPGASSADEPVGVTGAMAEEIARWGNGPAVLPWSRLTLDLIALHSMNPPRAARLLAAVHTAAADAVVAAIDAQVAWSRPSFVPDHAVVAGATSMVLEALVPDEPDGRFTALAEEAAMSRAWAGEADLSDVEAGLKLGREIGERAIARTASDGADTVWDGVRPRGLGVWEPTPPKFVDPPLEPLAGTWRTWVIDGVVGARPAGPPPYGSPAWRAELRAVQEAVARRTPEQEAAARFWAGSAGTVTPGGLWIEIAHGLIRRHGLDSAQAARVLALTSVALADAFVCCWDTKYAYWMARPITADPTLNVLFPTPPFPSFTSGHSTISAAAAVTLAHLFPDDAAALLAQAEEAKMSRLWAGIHFPIDNEVGAAMGGMVGRMVVDLARGDGAA